VKDPEAGALPRVCGAYTLRSVLGAGGMAVVYRAEHTLLGHAVAIKMIRPQFAHEPRVVALFGSELQALARIRHPNVVEVSNVFESEQGEKCLVMELLEAPTLRDLMNSHEPILLPDVLHLATQVAHALEAAHAASVIHRDLKPDNVAVLRRAGVDENRFFAKVLDFGVAKLTEGAQREQVVGTLAYLPPELLRGEPASASSDAYAFGVLLYELCAGQLPFDPKTASELTAARPEPVPLSQVRPDLPIELLALVASCLSLDPQARPASMHDVAATLDRLRSRSAAYVHTSWYAGPKRSWFPLVAGALLAMLVVVSILYWRALPKPSVMAPLAPLAPPPKSIAAPNTPDPPLVSPKAQPHRQPIKLKKPRSAPDLPVQNLNETERLDDPKAEDVPDR
jgi:serine/threonine protein kinase